VRAAADHRSFNTRGGSHVEKKLESAIYNRENISGQRPGRNGRGRDVMEDANAMDPEQWEAAQEEKRRQSYVRGEERAASGKQLRRKVFGGLVAASRR
jgi:hypothetical protein